MQLYIVRHAEAVPIGYEDVRHDEDRFLTRKGVKQARRVARLMRRLQLQPEAIWTSPLVRAAQTAGYILEHLPRSPDLVETDLLAPPGNTGALIRQIDRCPHESLMLVGHEPFLGELLHTLATGSTGGSLPMSKAAVACIDHSSLSEPERESELMWLMPSRLIRRLLANGKS